MTASKAGRRVRLKTGTRTQFGDKPVTLARPSWDMGAAGPANRAGMVIEPATEITPEGETPNPNGVMRARRMDILAIWHGNWRKGRCEGPHLTTRQYNAAVVLRDAFEATQRAPGWPDNDRVQSSPKPDHAVTIQIDRLSKLHRISRHIVAPDRAILDWCVLQGRAPRGTGDAFAAGHAHLRAALDRLADRIAAATPPHLTGEKKQGTT